MLKKPTVLVLGAGASVDFGLPLGAKLAETIRTSLAYEWDFQLTAGDAVLLQAYRERDDDTDKFVRAAQKVAEALPSFKSIDDCLHSQSHNPVGILAGKMAIARHIMLAERSSSVAALWGSGPERENAISAMRKTWAGALVQLLVTGVTHEEFKRVFDNLTIVSFNYDRVIESILFHLIQPALDITSAQAAEAMAELRVIHPYGSLGALPIHDSRGVAYAPGHIDLLKASEGLFVYTEAREQPDEYNTMHRAVAQAEQVVFLGFGFHAQNVALLHTGRIQSRMRQALGTATGEPAPAVKIYRERVQTLLNTNGPAILADADCRQFMRDYAAVLTE